MKWHLFVACLIAGTLLVAHTAHARDAAFMSPGASFSGNATEVVTVEPKSEVKVGDTPINLGRRATFFFVNQTSKTVRIESITATGDTNVKAEIVGDDCSSEKVINGGSRCSVTIEATPTEAGSWTAELLLTHNAQGRIARARITGKTTVKSGGSKAMGLSLSTQKVTPVDFGTVEVNNDKAVRSALMVNDSNTPITLLDIEVIAPENGLVMTDQGCSIDMELGIGESCPVTFIWKPASRGIISTDLIIRHSGRLGFAVIPIRGIAKGDKVVTKKSNTTRSSKSGSSFGAPPPSLSSKSTSADRVLSQMNSVDLSVSKADLASGNDASDDTKEVDLTAFALIGTVGSRAIIFQPNGSTVMVSEFDEIPVSDGVIEVISVSPKRVVLDYLGDEITLKLTSARELKRRSLMKKKKADKAKEKEQEVEGSDDRGAAKSNVVKLPVQK